MESEHLNTRKISMEWYACFFAQILEKRKVKGEYYVSREKNIFKKRASGTGAH